MQRESTRGFARKLRKESTSAEIRLWGYLRKRSLSGFRFVRQATIGPFIVDFLCRERRLVIEVDGVTHGDAADVRYDELRTAFLTSRGYAVYRVGNIDVYENISGVLDGILWALQERPAVFQSLTAERTPSPLRGPPPAKRGGG